MDVPSTITVKACWYIPDGGTLKLRVIDVAGCEHDIEVMQHAFPRRRPSGGVPGRMYFNGELVPLRSSSEAALLNLLRTLITPDLEDRLKYQEGTFEDLLERKISFMESEACIRFAKRVEQAEKESQSTPKGNLGAEKGGTEKGWNGKRCQDPFLESTCPTEKGPDTFSAFRFCVHRKWITVTMHRKLQTKWFGGESGTGFIYHRLNGRKTEGTRERYLSIVRAASNEILGRLLGGTVMRILVPLFAVSVFLLLLSGANTAAEPETDAGKAKMKQFQGAWEIVAATKDGKAREAEKGGMLTFTDDVVTVTLPGKKGSMKMRVDFDQPPKSKQIDFHHWEGEPHFRCALDDYGAALYEIDRDSLKISFWTAFAWPKDLSDKGQVLWVLKKKAKE